MKREAIQATSDNGPALVEFANRDRYRLAGALWQFGSWSLLRPGKHLQRDILMTPGEWLSISPSGRLTITKRKPRP